MDFCNTICSLGDGNSIIGHWLCNWLVAHIHALFLINLWISFLFHSFLIRRCKDKNNLANDVQCDLYFLHK